MKLLYTPLPALFTAATSMEYAVVSPSGVGGVQETSIPVGPSWTAVRLVGAEATGGKEMSHAKDVKRRIWN